MGARCKGICIRYKAVTSPKYGRYGKGKRRCTTCEIYIQWDEILCPCCKNRTRIRSRHSKIRTNWVHKRIWVMEYKTIAVIFQGDQTWNSLIDVPFVKRNLIREYTMNTILIPIQKKNWLKPWNIGVFIMNSKSF